jgi:pyruvate kinase
VEEVPAIVDLIRRNSRVPICLDTQGAQVRCGVVSQPIVLEKGQPITLTARPVVGDARTLTLWPRAAIRHVQVGDTVTVDFHGAMLEVKKRIDVDIIEAVVLQGGRVGSNKAVTIDPKPELPALTDSDERAIAWGARLGIEQYALSFASSSEDVGLLRSMVPAGSTVLAKIESREGIEYMDGIISAADAVIIDRGDLSREVPIEQVPFWQKAIVRRANRWNRPVYVATNLLDSMVTNYRPTVSESNDIANTLFDGVHGLVLAAETAIGLDPVATVDMIARLISAFERYLTVGLLDEEPGARPEIAAS